MRAILTVVGKDKVGIVAGVSQKLAELNLNIVDMTQTIMQDYFTMMMILEIEKDTSADFDQIRHELTEVGQSLSVSIHIQNEDIFEAMHKLG
ncbi:MAG TPA: ACT domain-containing protein [Tetragenococcus sp.]|nr:ACT domain-containing protein [Tetragenococcus sp.]